MRTMFGIAVALALIGMLDGVTGPASAQRAWGPWVQAPPVWARPIGPMWAYPFECIIDDGYNRYHPCDTDGGGGSD